MSMHDTQPKLEPNPGKQPSKFLGKRKPLSKQDAKVERFVPVETFISGLPIAQVQQFNRSYISDWDGNIGSASRRAIEEVYRVETGRALILTFVSQNWYRFDVAVPGTYELIPTTNLIGKPAYLNLYANNSSLLEDASVYEDPGVTAPQQISGTLVRGENILNFGRHRTGLLIQDNEAVQIEYLVPKDGGGSPQVPDPFPNAIEIVLKGFTLPTKILNEARMLYGI